MVKRALALGGVAAVAGLVWWLFQDAEPEVYDTELDPERHECVSCGTPAIWVDGHPINPGPGDVARWCVPMGVTEHRRHGRRVHGPFIPVVHII